VFVKPFPVKVIPLPRTPFSDNTAMPLKSFYWNGLFARCLAKRAFVEKRIEAHVSRFALEKKDVSIASIRYVLSQICSFTDNHILSYRPTGWHGESGAAHSGGHLTVDFRSKSKHVVTHHVYPTNDAYRRMK